MDMKFYMQQLLEQIEVIQRGALELIDKQELLQKMQKGVPLRVKAGFDPTAPDLHLGHLVLLNKLSQLQALGHEVYFLIGDFTAMIGDPSGKNATRPPLSQEEVLANAETYSAQVFKVLDPQKTHVVFNSEWMRKLSAEDLIHIAAAYTVARMLERDDFSKRFKNGFPIAIHEFLYPLLQGYDSVVLNVDLEIGGSDQKFNLLVGRELQKHFGKAPQCVLLLPLLEGTDGVQKMSKSLGNTIALNDPPEEMFGKIMSISDTLMWRYYELLSSQSLLAIAHLKKEVDEGRNPMEIKMDLAYELVARLWSAPLALRAKEVFIQRFRQGKIPDDVPVFHLSGDTMPLVHALKQAGLVQSTAEAVRLIEQGAVKIDGEKITDRYMNLAAGKTYLVQVGNRSIVKIDLR
jgi:tyrosyl-tRNA synthetase